jgi:hypothetical protein
MQSLGDAHDIKVVMADPVVSTGAPLEYLGVNSTRSGETSLHDKRLIVERRSLRSGLRPSVETTESPICGVNLVW